MTIQALSGWHLYPDPPHASGSPTSLISTLLDGASEQGGNVLLVTKAGDLRKVHVWFGTVTTGATLDIRLETVDTSTGFPTGTLFGTNTNASLVLADTDDNSWKVVTLTADATVALDNRIAVMVVNPAASFGNFQIQQCIDSCIWTMGPNYHVSNVSGAMAITTASPIMILLEYSDGTFMPLPGMLSGTQLVSTAFTSASTPDERGNVIVPAGKIQVSGLWWYGLGPASVDPSGVLYDTDGVTALGTVTFRCDERAGATGMYLGMFASAVTLTAGSAYRVVLKPSTGSVTFYEFTVPSANAMQSFPGGSDVYLTTAKDPTGVGSWTDSPTKRALCGVLVSGLDDGVSAGGGPLGANFRGGFVNG